MRRVWLLVVAAALAGFAAGTAVTSHAQSAGLECIATSGGTLDPEFDFSPYVFWGWISNALDDPEFAAKHASPGAQGPGFGIACKRPPDADL